MKRRSTKQRETIYQALMSLYHPTAEEIYEKLRAETPTIGRATVFRNLAVLMEEGRAVKLNFPDEIARYDANIDGHCHLVCRRCSRVTDMPVPHKIVLPPSFGFTVEQQELNFYGLCCECHQKTVNNN